MKYLLTITLFAISSVAIASGSHPDGHGHKHGHKHDH